MSETAVDWRKRIALSATLFIGYVGIYGLPVQIGAVVDGLGVSLSRGGLLGTIELGLMAITTMIVAPVVTRLSRPSLVVMIVILVASAQVLSAVAESYLTLAVLRGLVGVSCGVVYALACACVGREREPDQAYAWGMVGASAGFMVLLYVLPIAAGVHQHKAVYAVLGLSVLLAAGFLKWLDIAPKPSPGATTPCANSQKIERTSGLAPFLFAAALSQLALGCVWALAERMGSTVVASDYLLGLIFSASVIAMAIGSMGAGFLSLRFGRALPLVGGMLSCAAGCAVLMLAGDPVVFASGLFLYSAAFLFTVAYVIGLAGGLDPTGRLSAFTAGLMLLFYSLGGYVGGYVVTTWSMQTLGIATGVACIVSAVIFSITARQGRKTHAGGYVAG